MSFPSVLLPTVNILIRSDDAASAWKYLIVSYSRPGKNRRRGMPKNGNRGWRLRMTQQTSKGNETQKTRTLHSFEKRIDSPYF